MQEQVIHKLNQRNLKKKRKQQRKQVKHQLKNLMVIFKSQLKINLKKKKEVMKLNHHQRKLMPRLTL